MMKMMGWRMWSGMKVNKKKSNCWHPVRCVSVNLKDNSSLFWSFYAWLVLWTVFQLIVVIFMCSVHDRRKYCRVRQQRTGKGCHKTRFWKRVTGNDTAFWFSAADETFDKNTSSNWALHWRSSTLQVSQYNMALWCRSVCTIQILKCRSWGSFAFCSSSFLLLRICTCFKMVGRGNLSRKIF